MVAPRTLGLGATSRQLGTSARVASAVFVSDRKHELSDIVTSLWHWLKEKLRHCINIFHFSRYRLYTTPKKAQALASY